MSKHASWHLPGLIGKEIVSVDVRSRFVLPRSFSQRLVHGGVQSVVVYACDVEGWRYLEAFGAPAPKYAVGDVRRYELPIKAGNKMYLPCKLAHYAGITSEVLVVGCNDSLQLWNPDTFFDSIEARLSAVGGWDSLFERLSA